MLVIILIFFTIGFCHDSETGKLECGQVLTHYEERDMNDLRIKFQNFSKHRVRVNCTRCDLIKMDDLS